MDHTIFFFGNGGGGRDRTDDLKLAKLPLSQLSYAPDNFQNIKKWWAWEDLNFRPHAYQARALTKLSYRPGDRKPKSGGAERNRTDDLLLAKQALSQLSYSPVLSRIIA